MLRASSNGNNPTDFMWSGVMKTNSSGDTWSGYEANWDEELVLNNVDLTGADRAWMSVELFRQLGLSDLYVKMLTDSFWQKCGMMQR